MSGTPTKNPAKARARRKSDRPPRRDPVWADDVAEPGAPPIIDPRIQQRRDDVEHEHARGRRRVILVLIALVGLGSAVWGITRTPLLAIDRVRVSGIAETIADEVVTAGGLERDTPMTDIDEATAARRIERLPWVATARVRREWPRTVLVDITERTPTAFASAKGGGWALVDATGRVVADRAEPSADLPLLDGVPLVGPPGSRLPRSGEPALTVAGALGDELRRRVVLVVASGADVELRLRPEGSVRLGRADRLAEKIAALRMMMQRADLRRLAVLDLRVPTNPVLTRLP